MSDMDNFLRNKLYDHPSRLSEDMWSRIEAGMQNGKKEPKVLWIVLPGILFAVLLLSFLFIPFKNFTFNNDNLKNQTITNLSTDSNSDFMQDHNENELALLEATRAPETHPVKNNIAPNGNMAVNKRKHIAHVELGNDLSTNETESNKNIQILDSDTKQSLSEAELAEQPAAPANLKFYELLKTKYPAQLTIPEPLFKDPIGCPTFQSRRSSNLFIEGYGGPLYAHKILSVNNAETGAGYLDRRRETEKPLFSWNAGVNIGWISEHNIGIQSGLNYEVINERFVYEDSVAVRNQTVITIDTIFNPDGSQTINVDTSIQQVFGYETQRIHNYHQTINIPIFILYQLDFEKIDIEFSGGPILNIAYFNRGKIVDPSDNDRWFTNTANGAYRVFRDRMSLSLSLSVSALYSVNENVQLFARPNIKYHFNSMSTASSPFNQRYLNAGISFGARYYISGNPNY